MSEEENKSEGKSKSIEEIKRDLKASNERIREYLERKGEKK